MTTIFRVTCWQPSFPIDIASFISHFSPVRQVILSPLELSLRQVRDLLEITQLTRSRVRIQTQDHGFWHPKGIQMNLSGTQLLRVWWGRGKGWQFRTLVRPKWNLVSFPWWKRKPRKLENHKYFKLKSALATVHCTNESSEDPVKMQIWFKRSRVDLRFCILYSTWVMQALNQLLTCGPHFE